MFEVCPTCTDTSAQTAAPLADRGINDRLVELHRRLSACVRARGAHFEHKCFCFTILYSVFSVGLFCVCV